jgi:hypothetical protein
MATYSDRKGAVKTTGATVLFTHEFHTDRRDITDEKRNRRRDTLMREEMESKLHYRRNLSQGP